MTVERIIVRLHLIAAATAKMECGRLKGVCTDVGEELVIDLGLCRKKKRHSVDLRALLELLYPIIMACQGVIGLYLAIPKMPKSGHVNVVFFSDIRSLPTYCKFAFTL